jgi:hypothetical protein
MKKIYVVVSFITLGFLQASLLISSDTNSSHSDSSTCSDEGSSPAYLDDCFLAISSKDIEKLAANIGKVPNINACDAHGYSLLTYLITYWDPCDAHRKALNMLLTHGCDVERRDNNNCFPLHAALQSADAFVVQTLWDAGVDINQTAYEHKSPLHVAVLWGNWSHVRFLLQKKAFVHGADIYGDTPLHSAFLEGYDDKYEDDSIIKIVSGLLRAGCDINAQNIEGDTPLHLLLMLEPDQCTLEQKKSLVRLFLQKRTFDESIQDKAGKTIADLAAESEFPLAEIKGELITYNLRFRGIKRARGVSV